MHEKTENKEVFVEKYLELVIVRNVMEKEERTLKSVQNVKEEESLRN